MSNNRPCTDLEASAERDMRQISGARSKRFSVQSLFEKSVVSLQKFDHDRLMTMHPPDKDHEQKRHQRWY